MDPNLLPDCSTVTYTGISYSGERFDFSLSSDNMFTVTRTTGNAFQLWEIRNGDQSWPLVTGKGVSLEFGIYKISLSDGYEIIY